MIDETRVVEFFNNNSEALCRRYLTKGHAIGDAWLIGDRTGAAGSSLHISLKPETAGQLFDFYTCEEGTLRSLLMEILQVDLPGLVDLIERDFNINLHVSQSDCQADLGTISKPQQKISDAELHQDGVEPDSTDLIELLSSKESGCSRDPLRLTTRLPGSATELPHMEGNSSSRQIDNENLMEQKSASAIPESHLGSGAGAEEPGPKALQKSQNVISIPDRESYLGKAYLKERGIRLETVLAHGLEIDTSIKRDRIIERLGGDIRVEGIPLSCFAKELIWFPAKDFADKIVSWIVRVLPTPEQDGPKDLFACASTSFRAKGQFVSASASWANNPPSLQGFTAPTRAQSAQMTKAAAKTRPMSTDPFGIKRFERSKAKTPEGYARAFNSISRELIGLPLTRKQQDEIRAQRPKLKAEDIDKNIYRSPEIRERAPRDMPKRRGPGWVCRQFVLPRPIVEGLTFLAKAKAQEEFARRRSEPRGLRRRRPRTANFYVTEALNYLLADYGLSQFCVSEAEPAAGRVRRFVVPTD